MTWTCRECVEDGWRQEFSGCPMDGVARRAVDRACRWDLDEGCAYAEALAARLELIEDLLAARRAKERG